MAKSKTGGVFQYFFNLRPGKGKDDAPVMTPAQQAIEKQKNKMNGKEFRPNQETEEFKKFIRGTHDTYETLKKHQNIMKDIDYMLINDVYVSKSADLFADEAVQADTQENKEIIFVNASSSKFEKAIREKLTEWGVNKASNARNTLFDIGTYGDGFFMRDVHPKEGVKKLKHLNVHFVEDIIQYNPLELYAQSGQNHNTTAIPNIKILQYIKTLMEKPENAPNPLTSIEPITYGYKVKGEFIPLWNIVKMTRRPNASLYEKWGTSLFLFTIAPFRQYIMAANLQAWARKKSFPIQLLEVKTAVGDTEEMQWQRVREALSEFQSLGAQAGEKDDFTVNTLVGLPAGVAELKQYENRMDLNAIADVEMYENRVINSVGIPKSYLIQGDRGSWGTSGQAILQQSKPVARAVFVNQSSFLEGVTESLKLHFAITGEFEEETFELGMYYPAVEETSDRIRSKNDTLRLAKDIIDNIGQSLGLDRDATLPQEVVSDILAKYSFLDTEEVEEWFKVYNDSVPDNDGDGEGDGDDGSSLWAGKKVGVGMQERYLKLNETQRRAQWQSAYFSVMNQRKAYEHVTDKIHWLSSKTDCQLDETFGLIENLRKDMNEVPDENRGTIAEKRISFKLIEKDVKKKIFEEEKKKE
jgi:hypothetical protein